MADTLTIPYASPVGWVIRTGVDTANFGGSFFRNEIYPKNGDYKCGESYTPFCQPFDCNDVLTIQLQWENDVAPGSAILLEIYDDTDTLLDQVLFTLVSGQTIVYEADADFSALDCPGCYYLSVRQWQFFGVTSLWTCGNNGDFETAPAGWGTLTGPTNTISQDLVIFYAGTASAKVTAGATPGALDERILYCSAISLAANTVYEISGYVREDTGAPWDSGLSKEIYWEILGGYTDATILSETRYDNVADGPGNWTRISVLFKTGSDTGGTWMIRSTDAPDATGVVNVDKIRLGAGDPVVEEARSQWICLDDLEGSDCYQKITYYNDDNSSGMVYDQGLQNFFWAEMIMANERMEDPPFSLFRSSSGTNSLIKSQQARLITAKFDIAPAYFHQIIAAASKHDHFLISGYGWHPTNPAYQPDYEENLKAARSEMDLIDGTFIIDNTYC